MKKLGCLAFLLLLIVAGAAGFMGRSDWFPWGQESGDGSIQIMAEGQPGEAMMQDVHQACDAFNRTMEQTMGIRLQRNVKVYVGGTEADYQQILEREFNLAPEEAKAIADISGGWTGGKKAITAINGKAGVMNSSSDRISTTAHELFHQVQYELSDGNDTDEQALFWLEEGSADYVGADLAARLGGKSMQKWILDVKAELMGAPHVVSPENLQHSTLEQRKALMGKDLHSYQMSDLMTWYLLTTRAKGHEGEKLAQYFRQLKEVKQGEAAFQNTFGVSLEDFLRQFDRWWKEEQTKPALLHFEAREGVSQALVRSLEAETNAVQTMFQNRLGQQLHGEYQIVLANNQEDLAEAVKTYCSIPEEQAKELAASSLWIENGSTVLLNASQIESDRQQSFTVGVMLMRVMQGQRMGQPERGIEWLMRGSGYLMGVARLGEKGLGTLSQYQRAWLDSLRKAGRVPQLAQMDTADGFRQVSQSYSDDTASVMAEYAVAELVNRRGWPSLVRWAEATRTLGDAQKAFHQVYGQSSVDFEAELQSRVQRQIVNAR